MPVYPLNLSEMAVLVDPLSYPSRNHLRPHHAQRTHHDAHRQQAWADLNPLALLPPTLHPADRRSALRPASFSSRVVGALALISGCLWYQFDPQGLAEVLLFVSVEVMR